MFFQESLSKLWYPNVFAFGVSIFASYVIVVSIYRLYFHPLAKFPGPFWARLTVFPSWWHTFQQDRHVWLWRLQEQYGNEFRYRPDSVLINTPTAYKTIFGPKGNVKKGEYYAVWPRNVHTLNTWSATSIDMHARKRRVLNHAFSDKAMRASEVFIQSNTNRWLELLGEQADKGEKGWSASLEMSEWVNYLVFDILGDLCFGKSFDMKEEGSQLRGVPELMVSFLELLHPIGFSPWGSLWIWLKPRGLDRTLASVSPPTLKNWENFVDKCLSSRTKLEQQLEANPKPDSEVRKDFFHWLFAAKDPETGEQGYDLDELYAECELLTIAGSDTTAVVLSAMFFYLSRFPQTQTRLANEIRSTFSSLSEIKSGEKLSGCKYLTSFIQEATRMTPPVSAEPSREVLAGGTNVDGHYIPPGLHVSTGLYCLSYNATLFPEPFTFKPERWLVDEPGNTRESVAKAESGFCSFSTGSRGCVGKNLAWLEMRIVMAKVVWMFEVRRDQKEVEEGKGGGLGAGDRDGIWGRREERQYQTYDVFVSKRAGPRVVLRRRV